MNPHSPLELALTSALGRLLSWGFQGVAYTDKVRLCWKTCRGMARFSSHSWEAASSSFQTTDTVSIEKLLHTESLGQGMEMLETFLIKGNC